MQDIHKLRIKNIPLEKKIKGAIAIVKLKKKTQIKSLNLKMKKKIFWNLELSPTIALPIYNRITHIKFNNYSMVFFIKANKVIKSTKEYSLLDLINKLQILLYYLFKNKLIVNNKNTKNIIEKKAKKASLFKNNPKLIKINKKKKRGAIVKRTAGSKVKKNKKSNLISLNLKLKNKNKRIKFKYKKIYSWINRKITKKIIGKKIKSHVSKKWQRGRTKNKSFYILTDKKKTVAFEENLKIQNNPQKVKKKSAKLLAIEYNKYVSDVSYKNRQDKANKLFPIRNNSGNAGIFISRNQYINWISPLIEKRAISSSLTYHFQPKIDQTIENLSSFLAAAFLTMTSFISKPIVVITPFKYKIFLFYFWLPRLMINLTTNKKKLIKKKRKYLYKFSYRSKFYFFNKNKLENLVHYLKKKIKMPLDLELTRLYYPFYDSNILVHLFVILLESNKFGMIIEKLFQRTRIINPTRLTKKFSHRLIPSFLSGVYIRLAGRIISKSLKAKARHVFLQRGTLARTKAEGVTLSRYTNKNKVGAYSITIRSGGVTSD